MQPDGTQTQTSEPADADALLDRFLEDPEGGTPEDGEPGPDDEGQDGADEAQAADEDEDAPPQEAENQSDGGRYVADNAKVRLQDGSTTTVHELKRGFLREADYTQKTQQVSAERHAVAERNQRIEQLENQLGQERTWTLQYLQQIMPQPPDVSMSDPNSQNYDIVRYVQEKAAYEQVSGAYQQLWANSQQAIARWQDEQAQYRHQAIEAGNQYLLQHHPEWKDPKKFDTFRTDVLKYGVESYGFSAEELMSVTDPRLLLWAHDAIKWRRLQESKGNTQQRVAGRPPVTPGRRQETRGQTASRDKDRRTLRQTGGRGSDGEAAFDRLLDRIV